MRSVQVTASRNYEVHIGSGLLPSIADHVAAMKKVRSVCIVSDTNVWPLYGKTVENALIQRKLNIVSFVFEAGEASKNPETYLDLLSFLSENRLTRTDLIIALGGGVVGTNAALMAAGLGADVTICDISLPRLRQLNEFMPKNVKTLFSSTYNIEQELPTTDLVIGAVLIPGAKTPHLITKDMLKLMRKGSVLVDVAIDQGGCFETSHPTTHAEPIYEVDGIVHYCVANIPGAVPCTSTLALTNATLPYAIRLADMGWEKACEADPGLKKGLNIVNGKIVFPAVAEAFGWEM